jgi:hypothetical protein
MKFEIKSNIREVILGMQQLAEDAKFAAVVALTKTAQEIKTAEQEAMGRAFKKVGRFTLNSLRVVPATKQSMTSRVYVKDDAVPYLVPNIEGGVRPYKRMEKALLSTGRMPSNTNAVPAGNKKVSSGEVVRILSALMSAEMTSGYSANRSALSKKRRGKQLVDYVSLRQPWGRLKPGIYKRVGSHKLQAVFFYVTRAQYKPRLDFYGVAERVANDAFPRLHRDAMAKYLNR